MVHYVNGDLIKSDCTYICHQVNCQGKMNSGIAKAIRERYLAVYEMYVKVASPERLGEIQPVFVKHEGQIRCVINMFAQNDYGYDGSRYTSYDAFWSCLGAIKNTVPKGTKIGFPDHIGSCRGGANWEVIKTMIEQVLGEDYEVFIYVWEG